MGTAFGSSWTNFLPGNLSTTLSNFSKSAPKFAQPYIGKIQTAANPYISQISKLGNSPGQGLSSLFKPGGNAASSQGGGIFGNVSNFFSSPGGSVQKLTDSFNGSSFGKLFGN